MDVEPLLRVIVVVLAVVALGSVMLVLYTLFQIYRRDQHSNTLPAAEPPHAVQPIAATTDMVQPVIKSRPPQAPTPPERVAEAAYTPLSAQLINAFHYADFDLEITCTTTGKYRAQVVDSPAGQASIEFTQPFSEMELENFILKIGRTRTGVRRLDSPEMRAAESFGRRLFDVVFKDEVR
jgi:hypothetical protein